MNIEIIHHLRIIMKVCMKFDIFRKVYTTEIFWGTFEIDNFNVGCSDLMWEIC